MYVHIINARTTDTRRINIIAMYKYYYRFSNSVTLCLIEQAKFSHDDFYTNIDWIFKLNEICISNGNSTNTLTNCIQCAFGVYFLKILQNTWTVIECLRHDMLYQKNTIWIMLKCNITHSNRIVSALLEAWVLFTTKPCSTHTKCDWSLYCVVFCLMCLFRIMTAVWKL